ncbi:hypothetical protein HPP92_013739 [Vanilla planifolia]|uniref:non-specific serine/threonine protein kinase n=1 Tax=Vanilla planifolia TaxID=51239 RepID=A0A835V097_VANPL|nr:hypothetical protein HPP92_026460 [Vanilla planifolia]KAG0479020.1 hypothetical protein HPP92_013739 [Vanilla planifolia]
MLPLLPKMASILCLLLFGTFLPQANPLSFDFPSFNTSALQFFDFEGDSFFDKVIKLTKNEIGSSLSGSVGRVVYGEPLHLWDSATGVVADFNTHFSFRIKAPNDSFFGDGLSFFLSPYPSSLPYASAGGNLGLVNGSSSPNASSNPASKFVAVEFDTFRNKWDPSDNHLGINVNSLASTAYVLWDSSLKDGRTGNAWVDYNASANNLSVFLTYDENPSFFGEYSLSLIVNLKKVLPEKVAFGFSASTGRYVEIHNILSWSFTSSLLSSEEQRTKKKHGIGVGQIVVISLIFFMVGFACLMLWTRRSRRTMDATRVIDDDEGEDVSIDEELEKGRGPKRFSYGELADATKNFVEELKLGEGGFGSVYRGILKESMTEVAIKRVSKESKQGKKEYIAEVKIISRLRHRNLVQLVGWYHGKGELMLVYEFLPNGSLHDYLYHPNKFLPWPLRYKAALGLASALLYLHEEWEECVVHRDVKPSNVMLDASFNAKLGDFGLARLINHERGMQTTVLAGTMGYLAPECISAGKVSKESDVYAFGVVALELVCGRRPVDSKNETDQGGLVGWLWELYGDGRALEAVDRRLNSDFNLDEMERLLIIGLWCAHPDSGLRPTVRHAMAVLNLEAPPPKLSPRMPLPMYASPPLPVLSRSFSTLTNTSSSPNSKVG